MRKLILLICFFCLIITTKAQISFDRGIFYQKLQGVALQGIDSLFIYSSTPSPTITYNYTGTGTVEWYKYTANTPATLVSSTSGQVDNKYTLEVDNSYDEVGYILKINGVKRFTFWAINYEKFIPSSSSAIFEPNTNQTDQCNEVNIGITNFPEMHYYSLTGSKTSINRICNIKYQTLKWNGTKWDLNPIDSVVTIQSQTSQLTVRAPYCNTENISVTFTLSGDQFANDLGITPWSVSSSSYQSNAVICKLTTSVTIRTRKKNNEANAPADEIPINYSAPIEVQFLSNANEPVATYYNWSFYKSNSKTPFISRTDRDQRYTFTEAGTFKVKMTASNSICSFSDSITVTVTESEIHAPNVFTPNGDDNMDEFRVAYKSITSFQCWIYNRWGRLLYTWTDPRKGWDGKINGKDAVPGPYFYVIKALGSDFDPKSTPNSKTHLRLGEYLLKGDINLLRGVK